MSEFKTLDKLTPASSFDLIKFSVRNSYTKLYSDKDLKQNAIEGIKHWRKLRNNIRKDMRNELPKDIFKLRFENINEIYESKISSFKHFFNITDEDLKSDKYSGVGNIQLKSTEKIDPEKSEDMYRDDE